MLAEKKGQPGESRISDPAGRRLWAQLAAGLVVVALVGPPLYLWYRAKQRREAVERLAEQLRKAATACFAFQVDWAFIPPPARSPDGYYTAIDWTAYHGARRAKDYDALTGYFPHGATPLGIYYSFDHRGLDAIFLESNGESFVYVVGASNYASFVLAASGPDGDRDIVPEAVLRDANGDIEMPAIDSIYDPTNGVVSGGDVVYWNHGDRQEYSLGEPYPTAGPSGAKAGGAAK